MDEDLLREKGFNPTTPITSYVENFALRIGERATLVPAAGERSYGTVMQLDDDEVNALYGETSVADYEPEAVTAIPLNNAQADVISAVVYNLPQEKLSGHNSEYLKALVGITRKVGLPEAYIRQLEALQGDV